MSGHITTTRYLVLQSSILASGEVAIGGADDVGFGYVAPDELVLASIEEVEALRARVAELEATLASPGCGEACPALRAKVEAAVRATIEACKQEVFDLPTYQVGDDETKCVMLALTDLDPAPIVRRVLGGGE